MISEWLNDLFGNTKTTTAADMRPEPVVREPATCGNDKVHYHWTEEKRWGCPACHKQKVRRRELEEDERRARLNAKCMAEALKDKGIKVIDVKLSELSIDDIKGVPTVEKVMKQVNFFNPSSISVHLWGVLTQAHAGCWESEQIIHYAAELGYEVSTRQVEALRVLFDEQERMDYEQKDKEGV